MRFFYLPQLQLLLKITFENKPQLQLRLIFQKKKEKLQLQLQLLYFKNIYYESYV